MYKPLHRGVSRRRGPSLRCVNDSLVSYSLDALLGPTPPDGHHSSGGLAHLGGLHDAKPSGREARTPQDPCSLSQEHFSPATSRVQDRKTERGHFPLSYDKSRSGPTATVMATPACGAWNTLITSVLLR